MVSFLRTALYGLGLISLLLAIGWTAHLRSRIRHANIRVLNLVPWLLWAELGVFLALIALELLGRGDLSEVMVAVTVGLGGLFALAAIVVGDGLVDRIAHQLASLESEVAARTGELRQAKQAAEQSRDQLGTTLAAASVVPFAYDQGARIFTWAPEEAETHLGLHLHGRGGDEVLALVHPDDRQELRRVLGGVREGEKLTHELRLLREGSIRWVRVVASRHGTQLRGVLSDVTARHALEAELQQAHRLEAIGQLSAGVAHEINTPVQFIGDSVTFASDGLARLVTYLQQVERLAAANASLEQARQLAADREEADLEYLLPELPAALDRAQEGVRRVSTIVKAMKDFARGDVKDAVPSDLNRAIDSTTIVARNEYKYVARLVFDPGELPLVPCRLGDINQVLLNLIVNAAQAIDEKRRATGSEEHGTIQVTSRELPGGTVRISVQDDGCGIPEAAQPHVFEPFFTTKPVGKGSGQGLALSMAIARRHRGRLWFETVPGQGTTFHLELPTTPSVELASAA